MPDSHTSQVRISACMMVKDEEKNLHRCLASIQDWADEIVVVDTGSTDNTVSIARQYGARVYDHPWEKHFSKHRNQSIDYADGDWIFIIDADEELAREGGAILRQAVSGEGDFDAVAITVVNVYEGGARAEANSIRLFRNHKGIRYEGRVHNYLVGVKEAICVPVKLYHYGYDLNRKEKYDKFRRTTELLKHEIADNPANPRPHHFLGVSYLFENMNKEAAEEALRAVSLYEKNGKVSYNYLWSLYNAASAFFNMGNVARAEELATKGTQANDCHLDSWYILAVTAYERNDRDSFERAFKKFLKIKASYEENPNEFEHMVHNTAGSVWRLHLLRGCLSLDAGNNESADREFQKSRSLCPELTQYHLGLGCYLEQKDRLDDAEAQYRKAQERSSDDVETLWSLARISQRTGHFKEEILYLEKLTELVPHPVEVLSKLASACIHAGRFQDGLVAARRARHLDPNQRQAKLKEAICLRAVGQPLEAIRLLHHFKPLDASEKLLVTTNLAYAHYDCKQNAKAVVCFKEMAALKPEALDPPLYLSRLYLDSDDIPSCVDSCGKLSSLIGIEGDIVLDRLEDLGALYLRMGKRLAVQCRQYRLAELCFETASSLGCDGAVTMAEVGVSLMQASDVNEGADFLARAVRMAPGSGRIQDMMAKVTHLLEKKTPVETYLSI